MNLGLQKFIGLIFNRLPVIKNKVVFINFSGAGYGCNPKYIAEEIIRQNLDCRLVWLYNPLMVRAKDDFPARVKLVKIKSLRALYEVATASVWISNVRLTSFFKKGFKKKRGQFYLQTWHGSYGIKKMEGDVSNLPRSYLKNARVDSLNIDALCSNNSWLTSTYKRSFFYSGKIVEIGSPRNDVFFLKDQRSITAKVRSFYNLKDEVKIAFYVPTFRDVQSFDCYSLDYSMLRSALAKKFSGDWVVVVRMHPGLFKCKNFLSFSDSLLDGSSYADIQELLVAADIVISDYSSCIFDFMLSNKPAFIFATDLQKYEESRGLYYSLDKAPFMVATTNQELVENIAFFDEEKYIDAIKKFKCDMGGKDDGLSSCRAVEIVKNQFQVTI